MALRERLPLTGHQETEELAAAVQLMTELWKEGAFRHEGAGAGHVGCSTGVIARVGISSRAAQLTCGPAPVDYDVPGAEDAISVNEQYVNNSEMDPCAGSFSDAATRAQPQLDELFESCVNQIIVGSRPLSDLEVCLEKWRSRGGDDMRTECEQALEACVNGE